jgi:hypothetical protein
VRPSSVLVLLAAALVGSGAAAFNPDPRPAPSGVDSVCAEDTSLPCSSISAPFDCASQTCVGDPADLASPVAVRGTLTVIADEDVTGWDEGADPGADPVRDANARLTLLLQYEREGALRTFAETYKLGRDCVGFDPSSFPLPDGEPSLCVPAGPGWSQPASEDVVTDPQFNIVFTVFGAQAGQAIAADLTGNPASTARPYLDIVDRLPAASSSHGGDPLASVQQMKVTIRLAP